MIPLAIALSRAKVLDELFLEDDSPSSAVQSAHFNPITGTVEITFHSGHTYNFSCSIEKWIAYKGSTSKGSALSSILGVHGGRR